MKDCKASCEAYELLLNRLADFNDYLEGLRRSPTGLPPIIRHKLNDIMALLPGLRTCIETNDYRMCKYFIAAANDFGDRFPYGIAHDQDIITASYEDLLQQYLALRTTLREHFRRYKEKLYG